MEEDNSASGGQPNPGMVISPDTDPAPNNSSSAQIVNTQDPMPASQAPPESSRSSLVSGDGSLSWIGPEFISHDKSSKWYLFCIMTAISLGAITYFATNRDLVSSLTIAIAILVLGFYSLRKPKETTYSLSERGISMGKKNFIYEDFRAFTATTEGDYLNVNLFPLKRFAPPVGLCYRGNGEEQIVNFLSDRLPIEKHKPDILERILILIRF